MDYQRDEHRVHLIVYHLIWCPKRRKSVLVDDVAKGARLFFVTRQNHPDALINHLVLSHFQPHYTYFKCVPLWRGGMTGVCQV